MSENKETWEWADRHPNLCATITLCVLGVIVLAIVQGCSGGSSHADSTCSNCRSDDFQAWTPPPELSPAPEVTEVPEPSSSITFVRKGSYCEQDAWANQVIMVASYRNTGARGTISPLPVREYSDGSENHSEMDRQIDVPVPGDGKVHRFWARYEVDSDHALIGCSIDDDSGTHRVAVR